MASKAILTNSQRIYRHSPMAVVLLWFSHVRMGLSPLSPRIRRSKVYHLLSQALALADLHPHALPRFPGAGLCHAVPSGTGGIRQRLHTGSLTGIFAAIFLGTKNMEEHGVLN